MPRLLLAAIFACVSQVPLLILDRAKMLPGILYKELWFPFAYIAGIIIVGIVVAHHYAQKEKKTDSNP